MKQNWEEQIKNTLGDYQTSPGRDLWPEIERKLDKGNKKRPLVIPLWWKSGAIIATAASLALIILLNPTQETKDASLSQIEQNKVTQQRKSNAINAENELNTIKESIVNAATQRSINPEFTDNTANDAKNSTQITEVASGQSGQSTTIVTNDVPTSTIAAQEPKDLRAQTLNKNINDQSNNQVTVAQKVEVADHQAPTEVVRSAESAIAAGEITKSEPLEPAAVQDPEVVEAITSPVTSLVAQEEMAELIQNESGLRSWSVMPVAGPVYYNSLTQGSVFDPSFSDNSRKGDVTFSYGLRVNVAFNQRVTLRAGINNVAMGYATQDIEIATGPAAFGLSAVSYNDNRNIISVFDKGTLPPNPDPSNPYGQLNLKSTSGDPVLRANLNYLEFPLELSYALIDQQVKLSVISGVSGLFLSNNEVSVSDGQNRYALGALNNLNQFSFSTNFGLGLSYNVFKGLNLQLEPTFKYQLGAYSDANVAFTPYQLVLLSGLQFQF